MPLSDAALLPATSRRTTYDGYNHYLNMYMQQVADACGRRMTHLDVARWKFMRKAQEFCEAFTLRPPDDWDRARACLQYIQACHVLSGAAD